MFQSSGIPKHGDAISTNNGLNSQLDKSLAFLAAVGERTTQSATSAPLFYGHTTPKFCKFYFSRGNLIHSLTSSSDKPPPSAWDCKEKLKIKKLILRGQRAEERVQ
ncbi:unnamed protein product [Allacma fusca]|uniref:Uncharacterized protein n=1 Tax=Allacma fusca TaxID=39272 RepID=A0A8J2KQQ7_9HEXA|nr:unnamed protein product [Allacma fusca]